ncbi:MAG: ATP-binding protein, partial [Trichodesmium sp.]
TTTQELRQTIYCDRVVIYQFNPDWSGQMVAESVESGWKILVEEQEKDPTLKQNAMGTEECYQDLSNSNVIDDTYLQEEKGGIYSQGTKYRVVNNIYQAGFTDCYIQLLESFQAQAYINIPIISNNKLWGLLACYQNYAPRKWENVEINIVIQVGSQLGVALQQAELLAETQRQSLKLEKALAVADAASQAKTEFINSMNHELRTPLNAILGFTQLMNLDPSLSSQNKEYVQIINDAGEHLLELINGILDIAKIEAGKIRLNITSFDLFDLVKNIEQIFSLKASSKNLQFISQWDTNVPQYIQSDPEKLRQILINLVGNAIKFTDKGGVILKISKVNKNYLNFEVSDTGDGIASEEIDKLFQPFEQTKTGRKSQKGSGLGLAISKKFVELMGGNISVSSTVDVGTQFTFDIEISLADLSEIEASSLGKIITLAPAQPEYRIVVIETHKDDKILLVETLSKIGFSVQEVTDINNLINLWETWKPQLILINIEILIQSGKEIINHITQDINTNKTVVFGLINKDFEDKPSQLLSTNCNEFILKPFSETGLLEKISQYLGVRYIYQKEGENEQTKVQISQPENSSRKRCLTPEMLLEMPIAWIRYLHQAASSAEAELIINLLQEIPPSNTDLSETLKDYVNEFQFEDITNLTEKIINQNNS